jgi:ADP-ribose pyrophosphatase YjhB (NUDIX family)
MKQTISFAQKGFVLNKKRNKFLAVRYLSSKYLPEKLNGKLALPGGQMELGEDPDKSFIREIEEETGVNIIPSLPFYSYTWTYQKEDTLKQIVAVARLGSYQKGRLLKSPKKEKESTIEKALWIDLKRVNINSFVDNEQPVIKKFLEYTKKNPFTLI